MLEHYGFTVPTTTTTMPTIAQLSGLAYLATVIEGLRTQRQVLTDIEDVIQKQQDLFEALVDNDLIDVLVANIDGIRLIGPHPGDILKFLGDHHFVWTRIPGTTAGTYDWETEFSGQRLVIQANEVIPDRAVGTRVLL